LGNLIIDQFGYGIIHGNMIILGISFVINQFMRFSSDTKESHTLALKQIGCYLKIITDKGIVLQKCSGILKLNCWAKADFVGLYSKEDLKDLPAYDTELGLSSP